MSENEASRIVIEDSRVMLQIVATLTDDSRGIIYNCNLLKVQATDQCDSVLKCIIIITVIIWCHYRYHLAANVVYLMCILQKEVFSRIQSSVQFNGAPWLALPFLSMFA
jgi:hypothetical protein